ncbi:MAG TPA: hypothetical protein PLG15_00290 [Candidatus Gastranaerophilaceae bacterium]|nr:hypothetical protein [Candidatus Gastranaerophilaceae bacterium]HPT40805.1 hypothetical protein [Candidatus Gastranaerophilaceae bacterium]
MKNLYDINEWSDIQIHQKIGEILMQSGKLSLVHLGMALDIQKFEDIQLGEILLGMKIVTQTDINQALFVQEEIDKNIKQ